jgi:AraC-like DNA-binding protein
MTQILPWNFPLYTPVKLSILVETLDACGVSPKDLLSEFKLDAAKLRSPSTLVSINQMIGAYGRAATLRRDVGMAFRVGLQTHITCYGMYGLGILSATDFRQASQFATDFHHLAAPMGSLSTEERETSTAWIFEPLPHQGVDQDLYQFLVELQMGILLALHREMFGDDFLPRELHFSFHSEALKQFFEDEIGIPVRMGRPTNKFVLDRAYLFQRQRRGNDITFAETKQLCRKATRDIETKYGLISRIKQCILSYDGLSVSFEDVARRLNMAERTLRRRLNEQNTSFSDLLDEARCAEAVKILRGSAMNLEDAAAGLGFSDAANFRQAFRRWTGLSPQAFRRRARPV